MERSIFFILSGGDRIGISFMLVVFISRCGCVRPLVLRWLSLG